MPFSIELIRRQMGCGQLFWLFARSHNLNPKSLMIRTAFLTFACLTCRVLLLVNVLTAEDLAPSGSTGRVPESDWPGWRGAHGNGVASPDQSPPLRWGKSENVLWKAAIPGRGHSSPIVVGDRLVVATANED